MSEDFAKMTAELKAIGPNEDGRYTFPSQMAPTGYTPLRHIWKHADVHPSWLRTLISKGAFEQYDKPGLPAVIKNERGVWAVRIDAVQLYESGKRERRPAGEGAAAAYTYEPMVLKTTKRTLNECKARQAPKTVITYLETLVATLKADWEAGRIGKKSKAEAEAEGAPEADVSTDEDAEAVADLEGEEEDFEFDFEDEAES